MRSRWSALAIFFGVLACVKSVNTLPTVGDIVPGVVGVATSGPLATALATATGPDAAATWGDIAQSALNLGGDVQSALDQVTVGLQGAGALGYNAVKGAVTGAEQLISNTINTYQQIQDTLREQATNVALSAAFAPLHQADAAFQLLNNIRGPGVGPQLVDTLGNTIALLNSPDAGLPNLLQQAVESASLFLTNPVSANLALVQGLGQTAARLGNAVFTAGQALTGGIGQDIQSTIASNVQGAGATAANLAQGLTQAGLDFVKGDPLAVLTGLTTTGAQVATDTLHQLVENGQALTDGTQKLFTTAVQNANPANILANAQQLVNGVFEARDASTPNFLLQLISPITGYITQLGAGLGTIQNQLLDTLVPSQFANGPFVDIARSLINVWNTPLNAILNTVSPLKTTVSDAQSLGLLKTLLDAATPPSPSG